MEINIWQDQQPMKNHPKKYGAEKNKENTGAPFQGWLLFRIDYSTHPILGVSEKWEFRPKSERKAIIRGRRDWKQTDDKNAEGLRLSTFQLHIGVKKKGYLSRFRMDHFDGPEHMFQKAKRGTRWIFYELLSLTMES